MEGCWRLEDNLLTWTIFHEFVSGGIEPKFLKKFLNPLISGAFAIPNNKLYEFDHDLDLHRVRS